MGIYHVFKKIPGFIIDKQVFWEHTDNNIYAILHSRVMNYFRTVYKKHLKLVALTRKLNNLPA